MYSAVVMDNEAAVQPLSSCFQSVKVVGSFKHYHSNAWVK